MLLILLNLLLFSNALTLVREKSISFSRHVILGLIVASFMILNNLYLNSLEKGIGIYGGLFYATTYTYTFNLFVFIVTIVVLVLTGFYPRKLYVDGGFSIYHLLYSKLEYTKNAVYKVLNITGEQYRIIEYALIIVFILCGGVFLISSADLISIFLCIELQSYGLYILCTLYRYSEKATSSGLTYFLLGGLASCFILLGSALLYANSGTTVLDNIYIITSIGEIQEPCKLINWYELYYLHYSLIFILAGLLFKVSAAPFHFWSPDVYDGIPTIVTTYVAIVAKISIFAFMLELVYYTEYDIFNFTWKNILLFSSLFSLIIGSVLGLTQFRIKRLFAYSTISHVGFILLALSINTAESIQSYIFYILQYSISNLNAFIILVSIGYSFYLYTNSDTKSTGINKEKLVDQNNSPVQLINQIKGYFYVNPFIAISLTITLFSFVGIPPAIGFFAKQMVLSAALDDGYIFMATVAILTSVIGAGYYLNLIKQVFFHKIDNNQYNKKESKLGYLYYINSIKSMVKNKKNILFYLELNTDYIKINSFFSSSISILTLLVILFIYMPNQWFNVVNIINLFIFKA